MDSNSYTVTQHAHGIVVSGAMPCLDMAALVDLWIGSGHDIVDTEIAKRLGALFVVTSKDEAVKWRKKLGL